MKQNTSAKNLPFSNQALKAMIVPLLIEQFLVLLVGIVDTLVISYAGEAAVSGVSLVNQFNTVFIYLFTALASGGAVVISQYIGRRENGQAGFSASQLLMISAVFSLGMMAVILLWGNEILGFLFGQVESDVMSACSTYLWISALSYPFLAIYNSGAAVCRSLGKTDITMKISIGSNLINAVGNILGVFVFRAGVAGVAWPSLIARAFSAAAITMICSRKAFPVHYTPDWILKWDTVRLRQILHIALPSGLEDGTFQLVKVALSSLVALFGTSQIAANGIAQSIWSLAALCSTAMGTVFITVIGQCMGNQDIDAAKYYFRKLLRIALVLSSVWNLIILILTPLYLQFYQLSGYTRHLVIVLVLIHNLFNAFAFPLNSCGSGLRAAGDVRFTMMVSILSTIVIRLGLSYFLGAVLELGVIGIALAMVIEWTVKGLIFLARVRSGKWEQFRVIS